MNYSTECVMQTYLNAENALKKNLFNDGLALGQMASSLAKSHKFIFPPPYKLNIKANSDALSLMKLPYPVCAFEFSYPTQEQDHEYLKNNNRVESSKRIALAFDCTKDIWPVTDLKNSGKLNKNSEGMLVISFYYHDKLNIWTPFPMAGYIDKDIAKQNESFSLENNKSDILFRPVPILIETISKVYGPGALSNPEYLKDMAFNIAEEVSLAVRATLMLNTKNLKVVQAVEAPKKLNEKRKKNKKTPYFDYYTLDIFFSENGKISDRKKVNYSFIQQQINNPTFMKKWGTVRGHFKVRSSGVFWWNDHTRGNKLNGIIEKNYDVKPLKKTKP